MHLRNASFGLKKTASNQNMTVRKLRDIQANRKLFNRKFLQSNFRMNIRLDTHISSNHEGKKTFRREVCGKVFTNNTKLTEHIGAIHKEKKLFDYL